MSISNKVTQCLEQQGVRYQIVTHQTADKHTTDATVTGADIMPTNVISPATQASDEATAINVLLSDSIGKVQVLLPKNCLLDLSELCEQLGRNLRTLSPQQQAKMASEQQTETLSAVPSLYKLPIIIDAKLIELETVYLDSGHPDCLIAMDKDAFRKLANKADIGFFCIEIERIKASMIAQDRAAIDTAVKNFTTLRIKQRLDETFEMPPLPETAERIIRLRLDPDAGVGELAEIVEKDPSLAAQLVSWASSPYYAAPGTIKSVQDAVVRVLGFDLVINLALGLALGTALELPEDCVDGESAFWQQSVYTAAICEALVKKMPPDNRPSMGLAYLSGLLHNYGYLVLAHVFPPHFSLVNRYSEANQHINHSYIEHHLIGVCREQMGSLLIESWGIPNEVATATRWFQSNDFDGKHANYVKLLHLAINLLKAEGLYQGMPQPIEASLLAELNLDSEDIADACHQIKENSDELIGIAKNLGDF